MESKPLVKQVPGIYVFHREEKGFKFAYIGQSVNCFRRINEHLNGFEQHIDLSIRKHGFYSEDNPMGYKFEIITYCEECELDELEMKYCREWANKGYQLRNNTSGSQGVGKFSLSENKDRRGYREGVKYGENKCKKKINKLLSRGLEINIKDKTNKNKQKALDNLLKYLEE